MKASSTTGMQVVIRRQAVAAVAATLLLSASASTTSPVVSTFAGTGIVGYHGDGDDRRKASLVVPVALAWADAENLLYLDMGRDLGGRVRRIHVPTGIIETVAGGGHLEADSVPAHAAKLSPIPGGFAIDSHGNLFIGYETAGRVDKIDAATGLITRFAGGGDSLTDGVAPQELALLKPMIIRVDALDNVYILDTGLHAVFRVDVRTGTTMRIAGTPGRSGHSGDGGPATAAYLNSPTDIAVDDSGNLFLADRDNHVIRVVEARSGTISTFAGIVGSPGFAGDGSERTSAQFRYPQSLLLEEGALLVADRMNHRIRRIDLNTGAVTTIAGSGRPAHAGENVPALEAGLYEPVSMLRDRSGGLLVAAARSKRIYRIGDAVAVPVPWWQSGWAIATYVSGLGLLAIGVVQVRTRALRGRRVALERMVKQRSREIEAQKALVERQARDLSALVESRDRLVARISHEFRTPLTVIHGPVTRLMERASDGPFKDSLGTTKRHATRLLRLVEELLSLVRFSHGYLGPSESVQVGAIVRRVVADFDSLAVERGVALHLDLSDDLELEVNAEALQAVVGQLVSNAVKRTAPGGWVRVSLHQRVDAAEIELVDSGSSVIEDGIGRVLQPSGAGPPAEDEQDVADLRRALIGQLVAAQGGQFVVEGEPSSGLCVRVVLPLAAASPAEPADEAQPAPVGAPPPGEGVHPGRSKLDETVLVIEDNDDMREYLQQLITPHYRCLLARNGEDGVELALEEIPDLVLSDVMLPQQDGFSVCRALKGDDRTSHIPVVLITALEGEANTVRGLGAGADAYLGKPFDEAELLQRIGSLLEIRSLLRRRFSHDLRLDQAPASGLGARDQAFLARLARVVEARHTEPDFDVGQLAAALAMSERQMQRKIKALLGATPAEYLRSVRLEDARRRLEGGERPSDVALAVGFGSHAYFATCFKAQFGYAPGQARGRSAADAPDSGVH